MLSSSGVNAAVYYESKIKEQKDGYKYGQTMRMLGFEKWECNKFKNINEVKFEWCEYGWVDKSEEIDARADY